MTGREPGVPTEQGRAAAPRGAGRAARPAPRLRTRPTVNPTRKPDRPTAPANGKTANGDEEQGYGVELHPIGGVFGATETPGYKPAIRPVRHIIPRRRTTLRVAPVEGEPSLMDDPNFRALWLSRLFSQTAQSAVLYALLILVVDISNRSFYNSLFVVCANIPSIAFGLPAGVVVDTVPRRQLMIMLNGLRFLFMLVMVAIEPSLPGVFAATLGVWTIHQFYSPSESSVLASLVPTERYTSAQALSNLALTLSQLFGLVILAPLLLKTSGPRMVFAMAGALWVMAGALNFVLPTALDAAHRVRRQRRSLRDSLGNGWRFALADRVTMEAIVDDVMVGIGMSALVVIMPFYLERVLGTSKENTVFVFAPAALGLVLGLRAAPVLARAFGSLRSVLSALLIFALSVGALGFVETIYDFIAHTMRFPLDDISDAARISPLILIAMALSIPAGFASAIVNVGARAILLERTPSTVRGQVIATQGLMGNVGALVPTLLAGIAADLVGVKSIAVGIALFMILSSLAVHFYSRRPTPLPAPLA